MPANTNASNPLLSKISSLNPFGQRGYVQLPTHESPGAPLPAPTRREEEEGWFACKLSDTASTHEQKADRWTTDSEQMGPHADIWWLQLSSSSLLRNLLCLIPCFVSKASQVCNIVSPSSPALTGPHHPPHLHEITTLACDTHMYLVMMSVYLLGIW